MADPAATQQLEQLLLQATSPNTQLIRAAEEQLKGLQKRAASVPHFMALIQGSQHAVVRQCGLVGGDATGYGR